MIVSLILLALFVSFGLIAFRGAPYVPTLARSVEKIFNLYTFKKGERIVDLGCGDGRVLRAASRRGVLTTGYELNPFLWVVCKLIPPRRNVDVRFADYLRVNLPTDTKVVFVFSAKPFMHRIDRKMQTEASRLNRELLLISYGERLPAREPLQSSDGFSVYNYKP